MSKKNPRRNPVPAPAPTPPPSPAPLKVIGKINKAKDLKKAQLEADKLLKGRKPVLKTKKKINMFM